MSAIASTPESGTLSSSNLPHQEVTSHDDYGEVYDGEEEQQETIKESMVPLQSDGHMWWEFKSGTDAMGKGVEMPFLPHYSPIQSHPLPSVSRHSGNGTPTSDGHHASSRHSGAERAQESTSAVARAPAYSRTSCTGEASEVDDGEAVIIKQRAPQSHSSHLAVVDSNNVDTTSAVTADPAAAPRAVREGLPPTAPKPTSAALPLLPTPSTRASQGLHPMRRPTALPTSFISIASCGHRHSSADDRPSFYERLLSQGSADRGHSMVTAGSNEAPDVNDRDAHDDRRNTREGTLRGESGPGRVSLTARFGDSQGTNISSPVRRRLTQREDAGITGVAAPRSSVGESRLDGHDAMASAPVVQPVTPPPRGAPLRVRSHGGAAASRSRRGPLPGPIGVDPEAALEDATPPSSLPSRRMSEAGPTEAAAGPRSRYAELVACAVPTMSTTVAPVVERPASPQPRVSQTSASVTTRSQGGEKMQLHESVVPVRFEIKSTAAGDVVETDVLGGFRYWDQVNPHVCARAPVPSAILDAYEDREADNYRLHSRHYRALVLEVAEQIGGEMGDAILDSYLTTMPSRGPPDSDPDEAATALVCTPVPWLMEPKHKRSFYKSDVNYDALFAEQDALLERTTPQNS